MLTRVPIAMLLLAACALPAAAGERLTTKISWKKTVIDKQFRSEGVCITDVNKDGKPDIITGDVWYEAPQKAGGEWKMHKLRDKPGKYDPRGYSNSFCCFAEDFTGDGYPDVIVIPFPGQPCFWYENPGKAGGLWKEHALTNAACNETPIYVDLFKNGKRVLVMGWQPQKLNKDGKPEGNHNDRGEMCWFEPGKDPTRPWVKHSISGPSIPGKKEIPGTQMFSHGLGAGDVNSDGRPDVICTGGWWEQPAKVDDTPWKFHPANLGGACADMVVLDIDGDGKNDIVSSSAHAYGLWWHQQKGGDGPMAFFTRELLPFPSTLAKEAADRKFLGKEEADIYAAINRLRDGHFRKAALVADAELSRMARDHAERLAKSGAKEQNVAGKYKGKIVNVISIEAKGKPDEIARQLLDAAEKGTLLPGYEIGIGYTMDGGGRVTLVLGDRGLFSLMGATHAMHYVDIDGDGVKDLVTGRRYWAHAPNPKGGGGDAGVNDPAYVYWFKAKKDKSGVTTFTPMMIDDDSGVGTMFEIGDINGDGLPDIIISNKRGVFVFEQVRTAATDAVPPRKE